MGTYTCKYIAAAAANSVVTTKRAILKSITVGADVGSSVIEVSDSATDGDGNIFLKLSGSTLIGTYNVNVVCEKGITLDIVNQTDVTVIYKSL